MDDQEKDRLESWINRELQQLPEVTAPKTLVHRIMLRVHARARLPWWRRCWCERPRGARVALFLLLLAAMVSVFQLIVLFSSGIQVADLWSQAMTELSSLSPLWETVKTLGTALGLVFRIVAQPLLLFGAGVMLLTYLMGVALASACLQVALRRN